MNYTLLIIFIIYNLSPDLHAQDYFEMSHDGQNREYYLSYPEDVNGPCPLIINMHGFGGTANDQISYTEMDDYALPLGVAVAYPQGLGFSWNVGTWWDGNPFDDIGFISALIDNISNTHDIDLDRVYATGMSNGGYMTYELACELSHKIAAFGSVTGNFMLNDGQTCNNLRETPIMHFHGTLDLVVDYYPPSFDEALTVSESMNYWNGVNHLYDLDVDTLIGDVNELSAERFVYSRNGTNVKFVHYKVINGGHSWFGSPLVYPSVVNASELLVEFFLEYSLDELACLDSNGDFNLDGQIDMSDYFLILSGVMNPDDVSFNDYCLDMDNNGNVNIMDLIITLDLLL